MPNRTHLGRDGVVVLVDEHVLVDLLARDLPLRHHLDALRRERLLHQRARRGGVRMRRNVGSEATINNNAVGVDFFWLIAIAAAGVWRNRSCRF